MPDKPQPGADDKAAPPAAPAQPEDDHDNANDDAEEPPPAEPATPPKENGGDGGGGGGAPAADRDGKADSFLTAQTATAVFLTLIFWLTIFVLPEPERSKVKSPDGADVSNLAPITVTDTVPFGAVLAMVAIFVVGALFYFVGKRKKGANDPLVRMPLFCMGSFVLLLDLFLISAFFRRITYTPELKFTIGIGGAALASFIFGVIVYDTIRVAASLPIVILVIGLATYPAGFIGGDELRNQIIAWMGGVLGLSAVTEGVTQALKIRGTASVGAAAATANQGDTTTAVDTTRQLASSIQNVSGDLSPAMGVPARR